MHMTLIEQIEQDYITAFKNRESATTDTLRYLKSAIKNESIAKMGELDDAQVVAVLTKEAKRRQEAIDQFTAAGRSELAEKEATELALIEHYLPIAMDEATLAELVERIIAETGATTKAEMGTVMGKLKAELTNPADLSKAATLVGQKLQ
jgi:uncharacterized protein